MAKKAIRPIRVENNVAYVPLTQGYEAVIDAADVPLVSGVNWYALNKGNAVYAGRKQRLGGPKQDTVYMHRVIVNAPSGFDVDHKDSNGLNNRRCNLRVAAHCENARNLKKSRRNTSGYKGVSWKRNVKKWQAQIKVDGRVIALGYFLHPEDAHAVYKVASVLYHGQFGRAE